MELIQLVLRYIRELDVHVNALADGTCRRSTPWCFDHLRRTGWW
jgi:hypothetical protein